MRSDAHGDEDESGGKIRKKERNRKTMKGKERKGERVEAGGR